MHTGHHTDVLECEHGSIQAQRSLPAKALPFNLPELD